MDKPKLTSNKLTQVPGTLLSTLTGTLCRLLCCFTILLEKHSLHFWQKKQNIQWHLEVVFPVVATHTTAFVDIKKLLGFIRQCSRFAVLADADIKDQKSGPKRSSGEYY